MWETVKFLHTPLVYIKVDQCTTLTQLARKIAQSNLCCIKEENTGHKVQRFNKGRCFVAHTNKSALWETATKRCAYK